MILNKVNSPQNLKNLNIKELNTLSDEIRDLIIKKVDYTGGHMAPNLGIIEATIALHYVFNSPKDKFIFDVSHQCYTHKILTGRKEGFLNKEDYLKYTGYTAPEESEHDLFKVGHTSTSISLACGIAKARDLKNENYNVIALIGDGSLSGGEALEGLNFAAKLNSNFIIILNDNQMSIAQNYGGLYDNLKLLRETQGEAENNLFKALGYDYYFIKDGNNIEDTIKTFEKIKNINHPIVVHLCTEKGHGLIQATENKEKFHWIMPNTLNGEEIIQTNEDYTSITVDYLLKKAKQNSTLAVINAATPGVFGFNSKVREELANQYIDVAIAEEHATAMASAMAKNGAKPVLLAISSFMQRTYDQLMQDLALNKTPATILVFLANLSPGDATHCGIFDIPMMSNIPDLTCLAPATKEEYMAMLDWSIEQTSGPVIIRVPSVVISDPNTFILTEEEFYKYQIVEKGSKVAILGLGNFLSLAKEVKKLLKEKCHIDATVINPRVYSQLDKNVLENLKENHDIIVTLEDGSLSGGFGEKIASYYGDSAQKVLNFGGQKMFTNLMPMEVQYEKFHLTPELIVSDVEKCL